MPGRPFAKGQSGNPGGRPKALREVEAAARQHTEAAVNTLAAAMTAENATWAERVAAAKALLDRGHGRPRQAVEHTRQDGGPIQVEVLRERIAGRIARLAAGAAAGRAPGKPEAD